MTKSDKPTPLPVLIGTTALIILGAFCIVGAVQIAIAFVTGGEIFTRAGIFWTLFFVALVTLGYWGYRKSFEDKGNSN